MFEIKVWEDGENGFSTSINAAGKCDTVHNQFVVGVKSALNSLGKDVEKHADAREAELLQITLLSLVIAEFVQEKTGREDDEEFGEKMAFGAADFLHANIMINKPENAEKFADMLCDILNEFSEDEQEQPEGEANGKG